MSRRLSYCLAADTINNFKLPFLYYTRTIISPSKGRQASRTRRDRSFWAQRVKAEDTSKVGAEDSTAQSQAEDLEPEVEDGSPYEQKSYLKERARRQAPGAAAFETHEIFGKGLQSSSTMTQSEKEAFNKLLESLTQTTPGKSPNVATKEKDRNKSLRGRTAATESREATAVSDKILPIFRSAVEAYQQKDRSASERRSLSWLQESLKGPAKRAEDFYKENHKKLMHQMELESANVPATLEDLVHQIGYRELEKTAKLVDEATKESLGDYEIWKIFEDRIFPLMRFLGPEEVGSEGPANPKTKSKKKARKKAISNDEKVSSTVESATTKLAANNQRSPEEVITPSISIPSSEAFEPNAASANSPFTLPSYIPRLTLISRLYPTSINLALSTLIQRFPTSPISNMVLPRLKSLGRTSYVLGANTAFFNSLLELRWRVYSDLRGVDKLLTEMRNAGVDFDAQTLRIIKFIEFQEWNDRGERAKSLRRISRYITSTKGLGADTRPYSQRPRSELWWSMAEQKYFVDKIVHKWGVIVEQAIAETKREMARRRLRLRSERTAQEHISAEAGDDDVERESEDDGDEGLAGAAVHDEGGRRRRQDLHRELLFGQSQRAPWSVLAPDDSDGHEAKQAAVG